MWEYVLHSRLYAKQKAPEKQVNYSKLFMQLMFIVNLSLYKYTVSLKQRFSETHGDTFTVTAQWIIDTTQHGRNINLTVAGFYRNEQRLAYSKRLNYDQVGKRYKMQSLQNLHALFFISKHFDVPFFLTTTNQKTFRGNRIQYVYIAAFAWKVPDFWRLIYLKTSAQVRKLDRWMD